MSELIQSVSHATLEQLVTETKLRGSALACHGLTHPEGWPYRVIIAVASPGNEDVVSFIQDVEDAIARRASGVSRVYAKGSR